MEHQQKAPGLTKSKSTQTFSFSKLFKSSKKSQSERSLKKKHHDYKESPLSKETEFKKEEPLSPEEMVDLEIFSIINGKTDDIDMMFEIDGDERVVCDNIVFY